MITEADVIASMSPDPEEQDRIFAKTWFEMGRTNPNSFDRLWEVTRNLGTKEAPSLEDMALLDAKKT